MATRELWWKRTNLGDTPSILLFCDFLSWYFLKVISKVLFFNITQKFTNLLVQLSMFLIDLFVGTYRLSSHARLEAYVIQTKLKLVLVFSHKLTPVSTTKCSRSQTAINLGAPSPQGKAADCVCFGLLFICRLEVVFTACGLVV